MGKYSWHFTVEEDRSWLQEAMTNYNFSNPSTAISVNSDFSQNDDIFKFSVIGSENQQNILWIAHRINRPKSILAITSIAIHPTYRNQNYIREMGAEYLPWLKTGYWNVDYLQIITGKSFSAGRDLFGGPWREVVSEGMKISTISIAEI